MIGITSALISLPLISVFGTVLLWWLLPFLVAAVSALWFALKRSYRDRQISEVLSREGDTITLTHNPARGEQKSWSCNLHWVRIEMHKSGGPVDHYLTLSGSGKSVEIGRFLAEDERKSLFEDLNAYLECER